MQAPTISTQQPLSRRSLLRGAGATLALTFLDAMMPTTALAQSATLKLPPRTAFLCYGIGMNMREFFSKGEGVNAELSRILKPLERFRGHLTAFFGTAQETGGGHSGDYVVLTAAPGKTPTGIINSISCDQVAAQHLGRETRFPSLQLSINRGTG